MASTDPIPAVCIRVATLPLASVRPACSHTRTACLITANASTDLIVLMEAPVSVLHFNVAIRVLLVDMWVLNRGTQRFKLYLLGKSSSATHDRSKEACIANLPKLESQIDSRVAGQVVALRVKAEAGHILGVTLKDLPLGRSANVIDANWSIMCAHCKSLRVVMERNHWEDFDHVRQDDRDVFVTVLTQG